MKFGEDFLNDLAGRIWDRRLNYTDTIIIGDNSSGKSLLLKRLLQKAGGSDEIYFIDAVNRGFDVSKVTRENRKPEYKRTILDMRMQEDYFNLQDSFNCYGTMTERIEQIYFLYEEKLQELFAVLTGDRFWIRPDSILGEVEFECGRGTLSSGYQALVRLLLELLYYQEKCVEEKQIEHAVVVIDELDEFLSPGYAYKIFPFIKENFPMLEYVITTHSCDLVASAQNAGLVILDDAEYEMLDANDYTSASQVQILFDRLFGEHPQEDSQTEQMLRRLLNNRINMAWTAQDQQKLEYLQKEKLTASQQLILRQIMEW